MSNLILEVEEIEKYIRMELPEGGEWLIKRVPTLLRRINELERALIPFARQASREEAANSKLPLTNVNIGDCQKARTILSRQAAIAALPEPSELAAE